MTELLKKIGCGWIPFPYFVYKGNICYCSWETNCLSVANNYWKSTIKIDNNFRGPRFSVFSIDFEQLLIKSIKNIDIPTFFGTANRPFEFILAIERCFFLFTRVAVYPPLCSCFRKVLLDALLLRRGCFDCWFAHNALLVTRVYTIRFLHLFLEFCILIFEFLQ